MRTRHLFIFGVGRQQDVMAKGNVWYLRGYEEGFDRVTAAYPIGDSNSDREGFTSLVSLGTGRQRDFLFAPWRLYKLARALNPTVYLTADVWYSWWTSILLRWLLGARIVLLPVSMPHQLYADSQKTITGWPWWLDSLLQRLSYAASSIVWTGDSFGNFVEWLRNDPRSKKKLLVTRSLVESLPTPDFQQWMNEQPSKKPSSGGKFKLIYVGRLHPEKLVDHLIRMMTYLPRGAFELILIGDGDQRTELEDMAVNLGVSDDITFRGFLPGHKIPDALNECDAFVSTITGTSLREAALIGLPIIAYDRDWIHGLFIDSVTAMLCNPGDAKAMARAAMLLRDQPEIRTRISTNAKSLADDLWTIKNVRRSLEQLAEAVGQREHIKMMEAPKLLPRSFADVLQMAYDAMREVERDSRYRIDFGATHDPVRLRAQGLCEIDISGAVLVKYFGVTPDQEINDFDSYPANYMNLFHSFDAIQQGLTSDAAVYFRDAMRAQGMDYDIDRLKNLQTPRFDRENTALKRDNMLMKCIDMIRSAEMNS